ncbi:MAG: hypothetical protein CML46_22100 [Rhodobacteraceae bacterium]|nr:hypothetical protein [Paracoccaceae bacterium]
MKANKDDRFITPALQAMEAAAASSKRVLHVDVDQFQHHLDGADLSEDEKRQYLEAVWSIIVSFVDLGFGVHPLQQACGQVDQIACPGPSLAADAVVSNDQRLNKEFDTAAQAAEGSEA